MNTPTTDAVYAAVRAANPEVMAREQLAEHSRHLRRLRSWIDAEELRVARRARELERDGSAETAEAIAANEGGRSSRGARDLTNRAEACDEMPDLGAALAAGTIGSEHVDAVARARRRLDDEARAEFEALAADIVAEAAHTGVDRFERSMRDLASSIAARHAASAGVDELEAQRRASRVRRWIDKASGMHHTHLELDPVRDARLHAAANAELARLRAGGAAADTPWEQLLVDAFVNGVGGGSSHCAVDGDARDLDGRSATAARVDRVPEITVLVDWALLCGATVDGICETENGVPLPISTVRRLCCDAEVLPVVLGGDGEVLDAGRSSRTANRAQRRALRAMHRGCAHPGCTVGFDACRIHHVRWWWQHVGPTDIDNLLPLCERHHHLVHEGGWTLTMTADRVATWCRPDGTVFHHGSTIDRRARRTGGPRPNDLEHSSGPSHRGRAGGTGRHGAFDDDSPGADQAMPSRATVTAREARIET